MPCCAATSPRGRLKLAAFSSFPCASRATVDPVPRLLSTARRFAAVSCLGVVSLLVLDTPASAAFSASVSMPVVEIGTAVLAAPGNVTAEGTSCRGTAVTVRVSWTQSDSPRVSGYLVTVQVSTGESFSVPTDDATTSVEQRFTRPNAATHPSLTATVTTVTDYGWTKESPQTASVTCE